MNVLLFTPVLLLVYLRVLGLWETVKQLTICDGIQLVPGAPVLAAAPWRISEQRAIRAGCSSTVSLKSIANTSMAVLLREIVQVTVSWRCLAEDVFLDGGCTFCCLCCTPCADYDFRPPQVPTSTVNSCCKPPV